MGTSIFFRKSIRYTFYLSLLLLLLAPGCVSTSEHRTLESWYRALQEEHQQLKAEVDKQKRLHAKALRKKKAQKQSMRAMIAELKKEIDAKEVRIQMLEDCLRVELVENIVFEPGSAEVTREGREVLARIAPILKNSRDQEIHIVGHADELPPRAELRTKYPSNWELSTARATNVIRILQWGYGIDPRRLVAEGVAHYRPLEMENDQGMGTKNRSVEILLKPVAQ